MKKEKANVITIRGAEEYRNALKAYAKNHGIAIGDLVRDSVDAYLGEELAPYLALSLAAPVKTDKHALKG